MQHFPLKTAYVFNNYLNLFSETNYKKQTLILFSLEKHLDYLTGVRVIFKNLRIKKHLDYLTGLGLILLYIGLELFK